MKRIIKRYSNRKLYDVQKHGYVSLQDIKIMIQNGTPFEIVCHETGKNLTAKTCLALCFVELSERQDLDSALVDTLLNLTGNKGVSK